MKAALIADLHLGVKKSDRVFQDSQMRFFKNQFVQELKEEGIATIIVCGDIFDTRQTVNVQTENIVIELFKETLKDFKVHIIVGNHDIYHTTTTEVNSLKSLDLLPNVTVYEKPTDVLFGEEKVLMLPWVTKYDNFDELVLDHYRYAFAHLDIIGFDMGSNMLSTEGLTISQVIAKIDHTYTGHYHSRSHKEYSNGQTITYVGSPYQITRGDRGQDRGYGILDFDTGDFQWHTNTQSMLFTKYIYPNIDESKIPGNQVDIEIPFEYQSNTRDIFNLVQHLNELGPAYPVNTYNDNNPDLDVKLDIDVNAFNLLNLMKTFIDQLDTGLDKTELYKELIKLYDTFKGVNA